MIGDLHCHTRLSDGAVSIDDLIYYARRAGLDFIALTDHDTMDGVTRAEVLGRRFGINVIAGAELSCFDYSRKRKVHILCYLPDKPDRLQGLCNRTLESRTKAGKKMIRAVTRSYPVTEEHIMRHAAGSKAVYKVHIVRALMDLGYDNCSHGELFRKLFHPQTGLCLREPEYPDVREALDTVRSAGGIAVLAHPPEYGSMELMLELAGEELIQGVECFHPRIGKDDRVYLERMADKLGLVKTGGSDFHGGLSASPNPLAACVTPEKWLNALFGLKK